jgi:elongation factor G
VPDEFVGPVERGVRDTLEEGVIAGFPVTDVRVTLLGGRELGMLMSTFKGGGEKA